MARLFGTIRDDAITGYDSDDVLRGSYGNDTLNGGGGSDRLNGGRGSDTLVGGAGDDIIVSRSDGGETPIAQDINATNDPGGEVDAATRMIYANQLGLSADDILTGGSGADMFRIETLISAKREILEKHADPTTGIIDYSMNGVAGENNLVHDHWVDTIGNDVITDFNAAEGDKLVIAGHTTEVFKIEMADADGDGAVDDTVLHLRSNQGANGGAHNLDLLGTITVLNNMLTANDFTMDANPTYGIVENISQLNPGTGTDAGHDHGGGTATDGGHDHGGGTATGTDTGSDTGTGGGTGTPTEPTAAGTLEALLTPPEGSVAGAAATRGDDVLIYAATDDRGNGGMGSDLMVGGDGNDSLSGGWGDDLINGGAGDDHIHGGHGDDVIGGFDGDDLITGDFGDDILAGGAGNDELRGGRGEDVLFGGADDDILSGGAGNDVLMGGGGSDGIDGGSGDDALLLTGAMADYTLNIEGGTVEITDANGETDVVSRVELFHFLGTNETYTVENGAFVLAADTTDFQDLISDHLIQDLIADESAGAGGSAADAAAPAAAPAAGAVVPGGAIGMGNGNMVDTHDHQHLIAA